MRMKKRLHIYIKVLLISVCLAFPAALNAQDIHQTQIETEQNPITVTVTESNLRIKNAEGMILEIFSLTGEKVHTQKIEGSSKSIDISNLQRGYYIVKIGKFTRKIYIK